MAKNMFSDKIIFGKNMTPSPFDTDLCCGYVTLRGSHHVVAFIKCLILRRMQQIVNTNNTEATRNTKTLGGKPIKSSEILIIGLDTFSIQRLIHLASFRLYTPYQKIRSPKAVRTVKHVSIFSSPEPKAHS